MNCNADDTGRGAFITTYIERAGDKKRADLYITVLYTMICIKKNWFSLLITLTPYPSLRDSK